MSSWVPLRSAPPEPLCAPSTSYTVLLPSARSVRPKERRGGICSPRGRTLQFIRCQASPTIHSYHNAYKLLHQQQKPGAAGLEPVPEPPLTAADLLPEDGQQLAPEPPEPAVLQERPHHLARQQPHGLQDQREHPHHHHHEEEGAHGQGTRPDGGSTTVVGANGAGGLGTATTSGRLAGLYPPSAAPAGPDSDPAASSTAAAASSPPPPPAQPNPVLEHLPSPDLLPPNLMSQEDFYTDSGAPGAPSSMPSLTSSSTSSTTAAGGAGGAGGPNYQRWPYTPHKTYLRDWAPPRTSREHQMALTHAIMTCPTYGRLHELLLDNANDYNPYHCCATLGRMIALHGAGLSPRESRQWKEGCSTMVSILRRQLPDFQPRVLAVVAHALARLELPDRELLSGLVAASEPKLHMLEPPGLTSLLWAFARQGFPPPAKWMESWLAATCSRLSTFSIRDLSTTLFSMARLRYKMAPGYQEQLMLRVRAQLHKSDGRCLASLLFAMAIGEQHPGPQLLQEAQQHAVALGIQAHKPMGMTHICWSLAKLGSPPSPDLLRLLREHMLEHLPLPVSQAKAEQLAREVRGNNHNNRNDDDDELTRGSPGSGGGSNQNSNIKQGRKQQQRQKRRYSTTDMAMLMYALGIWRTRPSPTLGKRLLQAIKAIIPSLEINQLCCVVWACARLKVYPNRAFMAVFIDATYRLLPRFGAGDLSQVLWSLARLNVTPPTSWLNLALSHLAKTAYRFGPSEVSVTLWALARLGVKGERLPSEVLALFFVATDRRLSSFKPKELCSMIGALAIMRRRPDKEWTAEFLKATYHKLSSMNPWCLSYLAWALGELPLVPPPAWIYSYVNAARALLEATPVPQPPQPQAAAAASHAVAAAGAAAAGPLNGAATPVVVVEAGQGQQHTATVAMAVTTATAPSSAVSGGGTAAAAAGAGTGGGGGGLSSLDLAQMILGLQRLNDRASGGGGLSKVDDFLREAEEKLAQLEAWDGAYTRQQLERFLGMTQAGAGWAAAAVEGEGEEESSEGEDAGVDGDGRDEGREESASARQEYWMTKLELAGRDTSFDAEPSASLRSSSGDESGGDASGNSSSDGAGGAVKRQRRRRAAVGAAAAAAAAGRLAHGQEQQQQQQQQLPGEVAAEEAPFSVGAAPAVTAAAPAQGPSGASALGLSSGGSSSTGARVTLSQVTIDLPPSPSASSAS